MVYIPYLNEALNAAVEPIRYLLSSTKPLPKQPNIPPPELSSCGMLVRLAGLSGALAVLAGAYGSHGFGQNREKEKRIFQTGAYYHLIHSVALLGASRATYPHAVNGFHLVFTFV
ncbi:unnamed protein product [Dicrocoelium dendriticum]|nr:unnamed protein product [Dicrocoelium dendriticum]